MTMSLAYSGLRSSNQLIVLLPASMPASTELDHRVVELARSERANVVLLSLAKNLDEESQIRRRLISMAASIKYSGVSTDIKVGHGTDWVRQVSRIWRSGDSIACCEGHKFGLLHQSADRVLESKLDVPIYKLSGTQSVTRTSSKFWSRTAFWSGAVVILGGFLLAEMKVIELPQDWAHTLLLYLVIFVEILLLWLWNSLFS